MLNRSCSSSSALWRKACGLALIASFGFSQRALAQLPLADELFQQGKALLEQRRVAEACQKFEASLALARRGGTLLNLAVCREEEGRTASALTLFQQARERAQEDQRQDRIKLVDEHVERLRPRLSWLTITPAPGIAPAGLTIRCDDSTLPPENWGAPQAMDPGEHVITASARGRIPITVKVQVQAHADHQSIALPELPLVPVKPAHAVPAVPPATSPQKSQEGAVSSSPPVLGFVMLGVGATALAVGSAFGIQAIIDSNHSQALCSGPPCSAEAYQANERARTAAHVANVAIPTGAAVAGLGLFMLLREAAPAPARALSKATSLHVESAFTHDSGGLVVQGAW